MNRWLLFTHLLGASIWLGGMIVMGALVPSLRRAGASREHIRAAARQFGRVSWVGMGLTVAAGLIAVVIEPDLMELPGFNAKVGLVVIAAGLALWHQIGASRQSPRVRGALQGIILLVTLAVFAIAAGW